MHTTAAPPRHKPGLPDPVLLTLPPTATYARRDAAWMRTAPGEGFLVLELYRPGLASLRKETDTYQVEEEPAVGRIGRAFLLLNLDDPDQADVYRVVVGRDGSCTCKAGLCGVAASCKHRDALLALITGGHL